MLELLRQRNFGLLWLGQLISMTGDWVLFVALPFFVYNLTGSTLATGAMFAAQILPGLLLGSVAGVFVDRWDRKRVMIVSDVLRGLSLLPLLFVQSVDLLWVVYLTAFVQSAIGQFFRPARNAVIPQLVKESELVPANSLNAVSDSLTRLIGPTLGGVLFAWLGLSSVVILDAVSFIGSGALIALIVLPARTGSEPPKIVRSASALWKSFWSEWLEGLRLVRLSRTLSVLFGVLAIFSLADSIFTALLVAFVKNQMNGGSEQLGWLMSAQGVGGLLGGMVLVRLRDRIAPARLIALACLVDGFLLLAIFNVPVLALAMGLIFLAGIVMVGAMVSVQTLLQVGVSDEYRGRVFGAFTTTGALTQLIGTLLAGTAADSIGLLPVLDFGAVLWLVAGVIALLWMPVSEWKQAARGKLQVAGSK